MSATGGRAAGPLESSKGCARIPGRIPSNSVIPRFGKCLKLGVHEDSTNRTKAQSAGVPLSAVAGVQRLMPIECDL